MPLNIKIENFEGPFDLLLHLIKKNKMDIYDIKIQDVTKQYLEIINAMDEMDLEITSEFIIIAATLIEIKSRMLLPKPKIDENESDTDEMDPRKELVDKLLQYRKFKAAASFLRERELGTGRMFGKKPEIIEEKKKTQSSQEFLKGTTMLSLYEIYSKLMLIFRSKMNTSNVINREIPIDKYKIEDKMEYLRKNIKIGSKVSFTTIAEQCSSKIEIVVTFLALLELMKLKYITVIQEHNFREIYLERMQDYEEQEY